MARWTSTLLRVTVAVLLLLHGIARIRAGMVDDLGVFLGGAGLPAGLVLAWAITLFEIVGGVALAAGYFVQPVCAGFIVMLGAGILLVHAKAGWFVVGTGRNGMEFSVLLIVCLLAIAFGGTGRGSAPRRR